MGGGRVRVLDHVILDKRAEFVSHGAATVAHYHQVYYIILYVGPCAKAVLPFAQPFPSWGRNPL